MQSWIDHKDLTYNSYVFFIKDHKFADLIQKKESL